MKATFDFETRSTCDLTKTGAWVYGEHPDTEVICCAVKVDDQPPQIWLPAWSLALLPEGHDLPLITSYDLFAIFEAAETIEAHNCEFERAIWSGTCITKYEWPAVPVAKLRCSLAKCSYHAMPRALGKACAALGLDQQKDGDGRRLMLKMCKPRTPSKKDPSVWYQTPEQIVRLAQYCLQDVEAEHALSGALPELPPLELRIWQLDQTINARGIYADVPMALRMVQEIAGLENAAADQVRGLTNGTVRTVKQVTAATKWLAGYGVEMKALDKEAVSKALARPDLPEPARQFLELRQEMSKSSTAKYTAILKCAGSDSRIRGTLLYHGAGTGRWSGRAIQPQNFPRGLFSDVDTCLDAVDVGGFSLVEMLWGSPMNAAATCLRGILCAAPGKDLVCADFSSIEARVTAFCAGEEHVLEAFRDGKDLYKVAAAGIFGADYAEVTKTQRQVGKVAVLALGYQGGIGAFAAMAKGYGTNLEALPDFVFPSGTPEELEASRKIAKAYLAENPKAMSEDAATACDLIKRLWRAAHPNIVRLWYGLESAAKEALENRGETSSYRGIAFRTNDRFLQMRLPSGRKLHYHAPALLTMTTRWKEEKKMVTAESVNSLSKVWERRPYYGGIFTENCLAGDTQVITSAGVKRMTEVRPGDFVWDGLEWVQTEGCICNGVQEVGTWLGIRSTPEHLILVGKSWVPAMGATAPVLQEALLSARGLGVSSYRRPREGTTQSLCADATAGRRTSSRTEPCIGGDQLLVENAGLRPAVRSAPLDGGTRILSPTKRPGSCGCIGTPELSPAATTKTTAPTQIMGAEESASAMNGATIENPFSDTPLLCPDGTTRALTWTESITGEGIGQEILGSCPEKSTPETKETMSLSSMRERSSLSRSSTRGSRPCGRATPPLFGISTTVDPQSGSWTTTGKREAVYDLLNCGPRNRFTILTDSGPVIVHNCVQAASRDLMALAMLRVEAAGYPVVLSVHDELVSEIPEGFGSLEEYERLMAMTPAWASGCPVSAEGWRGRRYRK